MNAQTIGVFSFGGGAGKTTLVAEIARQLKGKNVLAVDTDISWGDLILWLQQNRTPVSAIKLNNTDNFSKLLNVMRSTGDFDVILIDTHGIELEMLLNCDVAILLLPLHDEHWIRYAQEIVRTLKVNSFEGKILMFATDGPAINVNDVQGEIALPIVGEIQYFGRGRVVQKRIANLTTTCLQHIYPDGEMEKTAV